MEKHRQGVLRRWGLRLLLAFAGMLVILLLFEGLLRLTVEPPAYHGRMPIDSTLGYRQAAGLRLTNTDERGEFEFRTNSEGFRGDEFPAAGVGRTDGVFRILFLGDSFLNAWAVREEDLMSRGTAELLTRNGQPTEAIAASCDDFGTAQELLLWRELGERLAPDLVVLLCFPGNDVLNNSLDLAGLSPHSPGDYLRPYLVDDGEGGLRTTFVHPIRTALRRSMAFAHLEKKLLATGRLSTLDRDPGGVAERVSAGHAPFIHLEIYCAHDESERWDRAWSTTARLLSQMQREITATGADFLLVVIPSRAQVQNDGLILSSDLGSWTATGTRLDQLLDWNLPERRLAEICETDGIPAVFLLEALRRGCENEPEGLYTNDGHLLAAGHAIAAREIAAHLLAGERKALTHDFTQPTAMLPAASDAPGRLDFRSQRHTMFLDTGWLEWRPDFFGDGPGWMIGALAHVVLPSRRGDLVVRGSVPPGARLPLRIVTGVIGTPLTEFLLETPGEFELRIAAPIPDAYLPPTHVDYAVIRIDCSRTFRISAGDNREFGVLIQDLGFESPDR